VNRAPFKSSFLQLSAGGAVLCSDRSCKSAESTMAIDHDQIFKRLIEAFFREFLELFCPANIIGVIGYG
jgi:hypothetical protein